MLEVLNEAIRREPIPVLAILCGTLGVAGIIVTSMITRAWRSVRIHETEASLKQDMLERGMSAEEIEKVVKASGKSR